MHLTTKYRKKIVKKYFLLSRLRDIQFMKSIESLLKIAGIKFEF